MKNTESIKDEKYFEFPVQLLNQMMTKKDKCLDEIADYGIFKFSEQFEYGEEGSLKHSLKFFGVKVNDFKTFYEKSISLYNSFDNPPTSSINTKIFWDYYQNEKTEFQKICLLAYLSLRSIARNKPYCKITNEFWFSRMAGHVQKVPIEDLPEVIKKYSTEHYIKKIKDELKLNWYLVTYAKRTRGFYVTFKLKLDELIYHVEIKKRKAKAKQQKQKEDDAYHRAMQRINQTFTEDELPF